MTYEILNTSGLDPQGQLGKKWTLYSIDQTQTPPYITELKTVEAASEKLNDQLKAIYSLSATVQSLDPSAPLNSILITDEYLSISAGTKSIVKQAFLNMIHH